MTSQTLDKGNGIEVLEEAIKAIEVSIKAAGGNLVVKMAPKGTQKTADSLAQAADCLVAGGKEKLFTPMYLMVGRKPKT